MKVRFEIENAKDAEQSLPLHCTFSQRGGFMGASADATWQFQDRNGDIPDQVAKVVTLENRFAVEVFDGVDVHANGARSALPQGHPVFLSDRDRLHVGALNILVRIGEKVADGRRVEEIVGGDEHDVSGLLLEGTAIEHKTSQDASVEAQYDPLSAFDPQTEGGSMVDPIEALGREGSGSPTPDEHPLTATIEERHEELQATGVMRPDEDGLDTPFTPRKVRRDRYGFEELGESLSPDPLPAIEQAEIHLGGAVDHVALRRLSRALGLEFGMIPQGQAEDVLEEIGASMRAAIEGLNRIYASRAGQAADFPLASMHMHAIEDNPLRFSESPDEAIHALFAKRGAVYLSAPAAVTESLDHLDHHQSATEEAVNKALDRVLDALSPRALERRFDKYARATAPRDGQARDAWCWQMYRSYFDELSSHRQRGLKMLFWEIFGYEYQALMRDFERDRDGRDAAEDRF